MEIVGTASKTFLKDPEIVREFSRMTRFLELKKEEIDVNPETIWKGELSEGVGLTGHERWKLVLHNIFYSYRRLVALGAPEIAQRVIDYDRNPQTTALLQDPLDQQ